MYKYPLFDLNFDQEEELAVLETIRSKWLSTGPKTAEFEKEFSLALNSKYAVALSNCTVALHLALEILGVKEGDEVICPSLTFVATVNAIKYTKATPVFVDVTSFEDFTIDPQKIEKAITNKTKAIVVMHFAGFSADMDSIMRLATKHNLKVVEDACHGPLSEYKGRKLGTIGDIGCFSFFSNKNMSTGEGGMLITNNEQYKNNALLLRSHGMTSVSYERSKGHATEYDVIGLGFNYRMDDIRSTLGLVQLKKLKGDIIKRRDVRKWYLNHLSGNQNIIIPFEKNDEFCSNYIFPILLKNSDKEKRDNFRTYLAGKGIQTSVHYPSVHQFSIYKDSNINLPLTDYISENEVTLPMYSKLSESDINFICSVVNEYFA